MRVAVLIDAENISPKYSDCIMTEAESRGELTVRRAYGNFSHSNLGWKGSLFKHALMPVHQYSYAGGKNAADTALIIDAMDLLYADMADIFCLVSSDSDFTRLAIRLREAGKTVIGMGEHKTSHPFVNACNEFVFLDECANEKPQEEDIKQTILSILRESPEKEHGYLVSQLGEAIRRHHPGFSAEAYGFSKPTQFLEHLGFRVEHISVDGKQPQPRVIWQDE